MSNDDYDWSWAGFVNENDDDEYSYDNYDDEGACDIFDATDTDEAVPVYEVIRHWSESPRLDW